MEKLSLARVSKPEFVELEVRGSTARQPNSVWTFLDRRPQGQRGTHLSDTRERPLRPRIHLHGPAQRFEKLGEVAIEGQQASDGEISAEHPDAAVAEDGGDGQDDGEVRENAEEHARTCEPQLRTRGLGEEPVRLALAARFLLQRLNLDDRGSVLFEERVHFESLDLQIVSMPSEALPKVVPGHKKHRHEGQNDEGEAEAQCAHRKKGESGRKKRSKDSWEKVGTQIGDLLHGFPERIEFFSRRGCFVIVGREAVEMFQYLEAKRQDDFLRGRDGQPASEAREDDASFITQEEKSHGRNKQPRISFWKNAIDKPSQDEGPQKSERTPEGKRQETRSVQGPHGTKRGREPAEFDGNEIQK